MSLHHLYAVVLTSGRTATLAARNPENARAIVKSQCPRDSIEKVVRITEGTNLRGIELAWPSS